MSAVCLFIFLLSFYLSATPLLLPFSGLFVSFAMWLLSIRRSTCLHVSSLLVTHYTCQRPTCPALYMSAAYLSSIIPVSGLLIPHYTCQRPICPALYLSATYLSRIIPVSGLLVPHYSCQRPSCPASYLSAAYFIYFIYLLYLSLSYLSRIMPVSGLLAPHYTCQRPICPALDLSAAYLSRIIPISELLAPHYTCQRPICPLCYLSAAFPSLSHLLIFPSLHMIASNLSRIICQRLIRHIFLLSAVFLSALLPVSGVFVRGCCLCVIAVYGSAGNFLFPLACRHWACHEAFKSLSIPHPSPPYPIQA